MFYIDDSGDSASRLVVFGWLEVDARAWSPALRRWLDWRNQLHRATGIPTDYELHSTVFVGGRGRPTGTEWDKHKAARSTVIAQALDTIATTDGVSVGAVYAQAPAEANYHAFKARAYAALVRMVDDRLTAAGELGLIVMDGDGTDHSYRAAHRELKLATRSLIEDPFFHGSNTSQWIQQADIVAYSAYQHLMRKPKKEATWGWYSEILAAASVTGDVPQQIRW